MTTSNLPVPEFFNADRANVVWRIPYETRAGQARDWARLHSLQPASADRTRSWLMLIDVQNTFCISQDRARRARRGGG